MYVLICQICNKEFSIGKVYQNGRSTCSTECRSLLRKNTNIKKYGVDNASKSDTIKQLKTDTFIKHYGVDYYFLTEEFKDQKEVTLKEKYGVTHQSKSDVVKSKKKKTMVSRYGVENPSQYSEFKEKRTQSHIKKFGVTNSVYIGKSTESIEILMNFEKLKDLNATMNLMDIARKFNISYQSLSLKFHQHNIKPTQHKCSSLEQGIREYITTLYTATIEFGNRSILNGKEIDIFLPGLNIGIECNGAYWHGELRGRQKYYHLSKMLLAESKGIKLMQIWDHEWIMHNSLIKDMLYNILIPTSKKKILFPNITPRDKRVVYEQMGKTLIDTTEPSCLYINGYLDLSPVEIIGADRVWDCGNDIWR